MAKREELRSVGSIISRVLLCLAARAAGYTSDARGAAASSQVTLSS